MSKGYGYGSSTKSGKGYGSGTGYSAGKDKHSNEEKAIFHGLKAARRWARDGQYSDAAEIAKAVSECWIRSQSKTIDLPDMKEIEDGGSLREELGHAENEVKAGNYTHAARQAWAAAAGYLEATSDE